MLMNFIMRRTMNGAIHIQYWDFKLELLPNPQYLINLRNWDGTDLVEYIEKAADSTRKVDLILTVLIKVAEDPNLDTRVVYALCQIPEVFNFLMERDIRQFISDIPNIPVIRLLTQNDNGKIKIIRDFNPWTPEDRSEIDKLYYETAAHPVRTFNSFWISDISFKYT